MTNLGDDTSVAVALRIRPQSAAERIEMCRVCTTVTPGHPQVVLGKDKAFTFDNVFDREAKQPQIYESCIRGLVEGCLEGYNATVLAYGQTGSGKTYTMGTGFDVTVGTEEEGMLPRAVAHLFAGIDKRKSEAKQRNEPQPDFKITVQFMELYNEDLIDLFDLDNRAKKGNIKIHEDSNGIIYTVGVTMKPVSSNQDTLNCLQQGVLSRTTASTNMNAQSSRSHAIFTIHVRQQRVVKLNSDDESSGDKINDYEYESLTAKFNFVDLAGSERLKRTGATGDRAKEGISINCGLLALGNVISALGDLTKKGFHVPYRDSKLTRLLQDSLGGNSRTLMIACVSPSDRDFMETLNTLKYANRARNIKNKVVVNQDKASKQISALRAEIQKLTLELMDYKQGKRASGVEGEHASDITHENSMLKTENDKMRVRIKALQQTIETQCNRITDLMAAQAVAQINGEVDSGVEELIQKYLKEIEDLRNKLTETEGIAMAITRRAMLKSRMNSPGATMNSGTVSVLEMAKMDLAKQRQKAQKLESAHNPKDLLDQVWQEDGMQMSDESSSDEGEENEEESETAEDGEGAGDEDSDEDESDDKDENENEDALRGDLADLTTEIAIKEKLIDELEQSQKKIQVLKTQYEEKLTLLQNKIKETQDERDHVLQNMKQQDAKSDKVKEIKASYEKKINSLESEVKKMQVAKKEHQRLMRQKAQNEQQLRVMTNDLSEMKKTKVRLMKQMKDEMSKNKQQEARRNKEIAQLRRESRQRELAIRNLQSEKRQREAVLRRKQEEIKALRRERKPVSGQLGNTRNQVTISSLPVNGFAYEAPNESSAPSIPSSIPNPFPSSRLRRGGSKIPSTRSPRKSKEQLSRAAKKKWDMTEKKITSLVIKKQTIANLETDMDRWIQDRDRLSRQLEKCQRKNEEAVKNKDENIMKETSDQLEALTAHMDYVQENIADSQASIMEMEEECGDASEIGELIATASLSESRILLEHFLTKTMALSMESCGKDAAVKEMEAKLNAMKQHNELQQELLQHVLQQHDPMFSSAENLPQICGGQSDDGDKTIAYQAAERLCSSMSKLDALAKDDRQLPSSDAGSGRGSAERVSDPAAKPKDKARRRTGFQEDFLYPDRNKRKRDSFFPKLEQLDEPDGTLEPALPLPSSGLEPKPPKQISPELMQKLLELEKSRKLQDSCLMPPPMAPSDGNKGDDSASGTKNDRSALQGRSQSMVNVLINGQLPASMVRGNLRSKSAHSYQNSKYGNTVQGQLMKPRSQPSSPTNQRKSFDKNLIGPSSGGEDGGGVQKENVFARLTSSMAQDSDPDVGRMLPLRPPVGKPAALVCTYAATGHNSAVLDLDVTEDTMFTASKDRTVKIWDLNTGEETMSLGGHKRDVVAVRYCPQTQQVFSVSQNIIKIWDIRSDPCKCIKTLLPPGSSAIGSFISSMTQDSQINDLKINSAGTLLYAALGSTVRVWDLNTYSMTGKLSGHTATVMTLLLCERNDNTLLFTGSKDHYIKAYELDEASLGIQPAKYKLDPPHYDGVQSLALLGNKLFSGSRDNSIKKWDLSTRQMEQHVTGAHKDWVCSLDFLPSRNILLSGCRGGLLKLWHVDRCTPVCDIKAHKHPIHAVATNSSCVFTASSDRLVRLWRPTGTLDEQIHDAERSVQV